jgi:hypothetical protein
LRPDGLALEQAEIAADLLLRKINRGGVVETVRLSTDGVRQILRGARQRPG